MSDTPVHPEQSTLVTGEARGDDFPILVDSPAEKPRRARKPKAAEPAPVSKTTISISSDLHARLVAESERRLFGVQRLAERAIEAFLDDHENDVVL
jgi:hypothetical protein